MHQCTAPNHWEKETITFHMQNNRLGVYNLHFLNAQIYILKVLQVEGAFLMKHIFLALQPLLVHKAQDI